MPMPPTVLLACANVVNPLLARASRQEQDLLVSPKTQKQALLLARQENRAGGVDVDLEWSAAPPRR
jgi:hypothetical protein